MFRFVNESIERTLAFCNCTDFADRMMQNLNTLQDIIIGNGYWVESADIQSAQSAAERGHADYSADVLHSGHVVGRLVLHFDNGDLSLARVITLAGAL